MRITVEIDDQHVRDARSIGDGEPTDEQIAEAVESSVADLLSGPAEDRDRREMREQRRQRRNEARSAVSAAVQ